MKIPFRDEQVKEGTKRTYWPRGDALDKRRAMRIEMESALARKGKRYTKADRVKALNDRWGEFCESQRSIEEARER